MLPVPVQPPNLGAILAGHQPQLSTNQLAIQQALQRLFALAASMHAPPPGLPNGGAPPQGSQPGPPMPFHPTDVYPGPPDPAAALRGGVPDVPVNVPLGSLRSDVHMPSVPGLSPGITRTPIAHDSPVISHPARLEGLRARRRTRAY